MPRYAGVGRKRWCRKHGSEFGDAKLNVNKFGLADLPRDASLAARVLSRIGCVLDRPVCMPWDFDAWHSVLLALCPPIAGAPISAAHFSSLFFAHAVKWPPLVLQWVQNVEVKDRRLAAMRTYVWARGRAGAGSWGRRT